MAWYWPKIEDEHSAEAAVKPAIGVSAFVAGMSGLVAVLSLLYKKPIFGFNGWSLVDAALFVLVAWRIKKMSRTWSVLGLLIYLLEIVFNVATSKPGAIGVLTVVFILMYIGAIRATFSYHKYQDARRSAEPPPQPQPAD
jgi:hypothetical protein